MRRSAASIVLAALATTGGAFAQTYDFTIDQRASSVDTSIEIGAPLVGTFIGSFDEKANPDGTKTIPGPFGGSGNNPIDYSAGLTIGGDIDAPPTGGFQVVLDIPGFAAEVSGLSLDLLGGETFGIGATLTIEYDTFHTQQPTALYIGGFELPIPFPDIVQITSLTAVQTGPGVGTLFEQSPGIYSFGALVPVDLSAVVVVQGEPVSDGAPIPAVLPITGLLDLNAKPPVLVATAENLFEQEQPIDPPFAFENQPQDIPTLLPPGGTAHLLFSGSVASIAASFASDITLVATGSLICTGADLNCDGVVDSADLGLLVGAWGSAGPGDLNGDGVVDGADLGLLLAAWSA